MNSILGFTELLQKQAENELFKKYLENIYSSGTMMLQLINDILDLSKIETGKLGLADSPVNLEQFAQQIEEPIQLKAAKKRSIFRFRRMKTSHLPCCWMRYAFAKFC